MFQACSVISGSQFVCFTPSLVETTSSSDRDVNSDCGPAVKYHDLTNKLAVRIRDNLFLVFRPEPQTWLHCVRCLSELNLR